MRLRWASALAAAIVAACTQSPDAPVAPPLAAPPARPNFLLIVVDDMGYTDIGSFGGEIETPNLDALAEEGLRLTNFHTATTCSPTRSMLLTGVTSHRAGLGNMLEETAPNQKGQPGYEGYLNDRVVTLATRLRDHGYDTMMSGKWHLGLTPETGPAARGFEHSFALLTGGASHFADMRPAYAPDPKAKALYHEDGQPLAALPEQFEYSSQYYVDKLIGYLKQNADSEQPFFAYLSFTAPHWPLQAPAESIEKYRGRYDHGYDALLRTRLAGAKAQGVIPADAPAAAAPPKHKPWDRLSDDDKLSAARAMEVYAAMIDEVDQHTGRLVEYLKSSGRFDNTVILFMSDNGPEGHDLDETWDPKLFPKIRTTIDTTHDFSLDAMGHPGSYTLYGPNWARAGNAAYQLYKAFPTEGGTRVAAFAHYRGFQRQSISNALFPVVDVTPTVLEMAGVPVSHDGAADPNKAIEPITGRSQVAMLKGDPQAQQGEPRVLVTELFGKRAVRQGKWKISHLPPPYGTNTWQLFNLDEDIGEARDVSARHPQVRERLIAHWDVYARQNNVILPDWVSGY